MSNLDLLMNSYDKTTKQRYKELGITSDELSYLQNDFNLVTSLERAHDLNQFKTFNFIMEHLFTQVDKSKYQ